MTARRLTEKYGVEGAKAKVWNRLAHWTLRGPRVPPVKEYLVTDFWCRVGRRIGNA